ncbi:hypothetical protein [Burkholderia pseudomallei]|uniref:hypothetical protein n=1 Tax=Burkholderia pseudomallei TaxID=28450 RepID=UPI0001736A9B|nr:hypothetical protein [Burkholderia pseudomallei]EDU12382.1 conserved hypothetical protein [Burkholderia pseudomallei 1655]OMZ40545.1 hypothetical protein AQ864_22550 [Burkholderia pseudomallei]OMZ55356.1 hypothetical protein AQ863_19845 [Burkholderia pseudomallei]OMZ61677.1 hypothetical protein AQ867_17365 [Burkholderia pseudomallei]OMZ66799.1 hypothetical protein AQ866_30400 [Burkholderia pseudomallei]
MFSIENRADDKNRIVRIRLLFDSSTPVDQLTAVGRPFAPILPGVLNRLRIGFVSASYRLRIGLVSASMRIANPTMECRPRQLPEGIAHRRCVIAVPTRAQWASTCRAHRCRDDVAMNDRHARSRRRDAGTGVTTNPARPGRVESAGHAERHGRAARIETALPAMNHDEAR